MLVLDGPNSETLTRSSCYPLDKCTPGQCLANTMGNALAEEAVGKTDREE